MDSVSGKTTTSSDPKKNLEKWLAASEFWEARYCDDCPSETEDFIKGKVACLGCGVCKYLDHPKAADLGLSGNPNWYFDRGGLAEFWEASSTIFGLSDPGVKFCPSVSAASFWSGEVAMDERDFWECLDLRLRAARKEWRKNLK